ncbi:MAG: AAA family ATPase, partial [Candidatus Eremiobacteraeota bacterium]|nr:AAA family ATPase [Candidatus Eremiobacteraeota bacterium]
MKLTELRVDGFGKMVDRTIAFDPHLNVVYGPNEAGKSTLTTALLATLYGLGRGQKDDWRPWSGARYATALQYALADGRSFEVQRDFDRDAKGVRVYDEHGNDASAECTVGGKTLSPGHAHLGIPVEVFVNGPFVAQGDVAIDGARAERITHSLARALDGGPKEDAALGALGRLDLALATHVGKKKATVTAPLRRLYDELAEAEALAHDMRGRLRALDDVRARLEAETVRAHDLDAALREHERRGRALRAHTLRSRLEALREIRDDLAALQAERAHYDDVEGFPAYLVAELAELYQHWHTLDALARSHAGEA